MSTTPKPAGNSYGSNVFREVKSRCTRCRGVTRGHMQCDTGTHEWDCQLCLERTPPVVTEVKPSRLTMQYRLVIKKGIQTPKFTIHMNREQARQLLAGMGEASPVYEPLRLYVEQSPGQNTLRLTVFGELASTLAASCLKEAKS